MDRRTVTNPKSGRVFHVILYNLISGEDISAKNERVIRSALLHSTVRRYAYIKHDRDTYTDQDFILDSSHTVEELKPSHWHIILETPGKCTVSLISKWFSVPENQIEVPNSRGKTKITTKGMEKVFIECVSYLDHSRLENPNKYIYDSSDVFANFDWETEVDAFYLRYRAYGKNLSEKEWYRNEVLLHGLRPKDIAKNPLTVTAYTNDFVMLDKLRLKYLREYAPMPSTRYNYYIYSDEGRVGKGLLSKAFARSLYPTIENDDDLFFCVGGKKVSFDSYDGQPIIIWNDIRPNQLLDIFGNRGSLLDSLDMHPTRKDEHIKYGKICLVNTVNIFNSVMPYREFFDSLAGEFIDSEGRFCRSELSQKEQVYGRFPMIIPVSADDFGILLNKGIMGAGNFTEYFEHVKVRTRLREIHETLSGRDQVIRNLESRTAVPLLNAHNSIVSKMEASDFFSDMSDQDAINYFSDSGTIISGKEIL